MRNFMRSQKGDTIVEVLIATAVVSIVLTGALAISNNSLKLIRASQERSEAQAYAQSLIELLPPTGLQADTTQFCMDSAGTLKTIGNSACIQQERYSNKITREANSNVYTVEIAWDGVTGNPETLRIVYRIKTV